VHRWLSLGSLGVCAGIATLGGFGLFNAPDFRVPGLPASSNIEKT
jgi:hypothetical protein